MDITDERDPTCTVYHFHTDQVGMPEELINAQGQIVWRASYQSWGSMALGSVPVSHR